MSGYVVDERDIAASSEPGDTAWTRVTIDAAAGCERLEQRVIRFAPGRSRPRRLSDRHELLYVASGRGRLQLNGTSHELAPDTGAFVAAGEEYTVENAGPDELLVVSVTAPHEHPPASEDGRRTVHFAERPSLPASPNREFRYLVDSDLGCRDATQFVGLIPPGRAPLHSHTYDEVLYVVEGEGVLHVGDTERPLAPGSCLHLPPLMEHSLENTGETSMRVLGVFHPAGDPASRASER
ncbi:MAG: cupin domain-containing protein [Actinomycetota bacterium]|nr:cupin domain-containing protein [Actinomycetota bacterium]